ncbi:leucine rich repeats and immunoglobulin like domains 3 [Homo sapiens]|uniref:Isoform 2 of Leucine-rich repeats and immunoglobulin-like domains protein 3 n=1 Tax=Homo sapiens TaxID=9606 RepID=Q6UXM1-2|nr:leucine-rich repeats and immunoglobulin-like domains protein 3 isoform 1 precursor [Homo sapiens]AAQ88662.1 SAPS287 [Homo sapiens]EAW97095.1 leucine-rich repeats and immunoglobulin-like domains 3, isoform CRA_b [Homo sapiens]KAI2566718.1 leucine rich repeats and immunoglobulin like domains 3 [Homo sapiens]KAI4066966.1 leucine rich repeats and immunoglobulin like domains 3 [Homo sapiens]|eukprot:NP_001129523.1 leucine-rich repeats and immunoglobulin-like domains protein 3 isoform 1 precursor [Homo sapiens]
MVDVLLLFSLCLLFHISRPDLSHNRLSFIKASSMSHLQSLREVKLNNNELETIPNLGPVSANITLLSLAGNRIVEILPEHLKEFQSLETLDLSSNNISELQTAFPALQLKYLYLNSNRVTSMEPGYFDNLANTLLVLKLNRNRISAIPPKMFKLPQLQHLELNRNKIKNVDGLTFQGLGALKSLKMQRNGVTKLMDGAFWGLSNMEILQLDHNNLTEITKGWLYGLLMLQELHLSQNAINRISPDAWEFCQKLSELDLTFNHLSRLDDSSFLGLSLLNTLHIGNNRVSYIADCAFRGLSSLKTLDLKNNEISWTIEDMNGAFSGLDKLRRLILQGNRIRSITKKAFTGLDALEHLDLSDNAIMSLQGNAFSQMKKLQQLHLNTSSLLCDCQLKWLPQWVAENNFQSFVNASCAHPQLLKGRSIFAVSPDGFVCDDFPKPQITVQPETQSAIKGSNLSFICSAASSSDSPMTFAWKKDNELLHDAEMENYAHLRAQGGEVMEYTTILRLREVEFASEGKYQCVISNHFGSSYSVKAKLTVNMLPSFTKTPMDLTIRAGAMARLECAAVGHPAPQIAWQKDGGTDFPAARERRMHVMPEDDVFFIVDVKIEDIGVYSCTAQNSAGSISANATLTVLETPSFLRPLLDRTVTKGETAVLQCIAGGSPPPKLNWTKDDSPLVVTERHFFAAGNQLLIIVDSDVSDAGKYTCEMSNTLGTERGNVRLSVIPTPTCDSPQMTAPSLDDDGWATVGVVIIAVVCCVVGTSLVWVVIIYHTRRRNEDCSITNTDETNLPADIPSYLSSQGTLADRQDGYVSSESGSHHQFVTSSGAGFFLPQHDSSGTCHIDNSSEADVEAATDLFLCPFLGSTGPMYLKGNVYGSDPFETYHTGCSPDPRTVLMDHYEPSYIKKKECYPCSHPSEESCERSFSNISWPSHVRKLLNTSYSHNEGPGMKNLCLNKSSLDFSANPEPASVASSNSFMGTFGKALRRPHLDAYSSFGQPSDCQPRAFYLKAHSSPDLDSGSEEDGKERTDFQEENHICTFKQTLENYRTPNFQSYDLDT